jgi:CubicO group peptidase (beta-lactamase class C family)
LSAAEPLRDRLSRRLRRAQAEWRMPSVSAAVFRDRALLWHEAVGLAVAEPQEGATPEHQYRIGSITKTFTAVLVLQLRAAGAVDLEAPLRDYVPEAPAGPTVRQALSHLSGFQREPPGDIWETLRVPDREELLAGLEDAEQVLRPGFRWHYSNLAFALLGELVARSAGAAYRDVLRDRILEPLGLSRTTFGEEAPVARGYFVEPYSDGMRDEPHVEITETSAAMGQLWSTTGDLARWGAFLASGDDRVLPRETLDEMTLVQTMVDQLRWRLAWGLGLELYRRGDRVLVGHGGAMPGFLAALCVSRPERTGAVVLTNSSAGPDPELLALELAELALEAPGAAAEAWRPDAGAPPELEPLLGRWWSEGRELVFSFRGGRLQAQLVDGPPGRDTSYFERDGEDRFRVAEGRELGELLRVARDDSGTPVRLYLATYPLTRAPEVFGSD